MAAAVFGVPKLSCSAVIGLWDRSYISSTPGNIMNSEIHCMQSPGQAKGLPILRLQYFREKSREGDFISFWGSIISSSSSDIKPEG